MIKMSKLSEKSFGKRAKKWIIQFIKFNVVGFIVFLIGTAIFILAFPTFGAWTWLISSGTGGLLQFTLISYLNTTKRGKIFDACEQRSKDNA